MWRMIYIAAAAVIVCGGYVHGLWTHRWSAPEELRRAVARAGNIPLKVGDWEGRPEALSDRAARVAGIQGYSLLRYKNRLDGRVITVLLMCGRAGPISVHSPDVCYQGQGYRPVGDLGKEQPATSPGVASAEFHAAKFSKQDVSGPSYLHILWSWGWQGDWRAPDNARLSFAGSPALYKLYVIQQTHPKTEQADREARQQFLDVLLPEIHKTLFAKS